MAERKVYTMGEAARELGVSKTTVSRALSGKGRISEATRARVMEFVAAHGGLGEMPADTPLNRNERTGNIGLVLGCLRERKVRVSEDIRVVSFYDGPLLLIDKRICGDIL